MTRNVTALDNEKCCRAIRDTAPVQWQQEPLRRRAYAQPRTPVRDSSRSFRPNYTAVTSFILSFLSTIRHTGGCRLSRASSIDIPEPDYWHPPGWRQLCAIHHVATEMAGRHATTHCISSCSTCDCLYWQSHRASCMGAPDQRSNACCHRQYGYPFP